MYIIIDIGGTFIKIYNSSTKYVKRIKMFETNIINLKDLKNIIKNNIDNNCEKIYLSCQMHGFVLFDEYRNNITEFITLKQKSKNNIINKIMNDNIYTTITGLSSRNDLPINNIYDFIKYNTLNYDKIYIKNISEAILDKDLSNTHTTMACGNGFLNINTNLYCEEIINFFYDEFKIKLLFDNPINDIIINGYLNINNKNIPVYSGIGDFQASLFNIKENELYINMATGSQIAILTDTIEEHKNNINYRTFFKNKYLKCITHIPSGRFLNIFLNLFEDLFTYNLSVEDILQSDLIIENNIFDENGIFIQNININNFNKKNIISSIIKSYLDQYINYYNLFFKDIIIEKIILAGGIPKKIPYIKDYLEYHIKKKFTINYNCDDDSIFGIINLINNR